MGIDRAIGRRRYLASVVFAIGVALVGFLPGLPTAARAAVGGASAPAGVNSVTAFGKAEVEPGALGPIGSAAVVGIAADPVAAGYWVVASNGQVFAFGGARLYGSIQSHLNQPIVGIAATPSGRGYWLVAGDGGIFNFGDGRFYGSTGAIRLNAPVVGMAGTASGRGYWLVGADGGIFNFGDARFYGSAGSVHLNAPVVGMAANSSGRGYWLVASDGGIFEFGGAPFEGSTGNVALNRPVVGMAATQTGRGYWLVAADGGIFNFGDAAIRRLRWGSPRTPPAVGLAASTNGYWIVYGMRTSPIPAITAYVATRVDDVTVAVDDLTTGENFAYRPGVVEHTASTVKVDILATLLREAQTAGRGLTPTEQALAVPMIEDSLDSAADVLWTQLGPAAVGATEQSLGLTDTVPATDGIWGTTTTTAADRLAMMRALSFPNPVLTDASRAYVLYLMEHITSTQDWGVTGGVPAGVSVALKNGFSIINGWQINSMGWVRGDGRDYLIAVLTDGNPSEAYGIATADQISSIVWNSL